MDKYTTNPDPTSITTYPYAVQMQPLAVNLTTFLRGNKATFTTNHTLGTSEQPWPENTKEPVNYTRAEALEAGNRFVVGAVTSGAKYASDLPTKGTKIGVVNALNMQYTISKGDNKGNIVNLVMQALAGMRRSHRQGIKSAKRDAAIAVAEADGGAFFAAGVTMKQGDAVVPRPYEDAESAARAWARHADNYGATWWQEDKPARLVEAATHVTRGQPTSVTVIADMHHLKVINLAKSAGAPSDITSGAGAGDRCRTWFLDNPMALTAALNE